MTLAISLTMRLLIVFVLATSFLVYQSEGANTAVGFRHAPHHHSSNNSRSVGRVAASYRKGSFGGQSVSQRDDDDDSRGDKMMMDQPMMVPDFEVEEEKYVPASFSIDDYGANAGFIGGHAIEMMAPIEVPEYGWNEDSRGLSELDNGEQQSAREGAPIPISSGNPNGGLVQCGETEIDPAQGLCCNGLVFLKKPDDEGKCCGSVAYDDRYFTCCQGRAIVRKAPQMPLCCGDYNGDSLPDQCRFGYERDNTGLGSTCCRSATGSWTCCLKGESCCTGSAVDRSTAIEVPGFRPACCNLNNEDLTAQCCATTYEKIRVLPDCCERDRLKPVCCQGKDPSRPIKCCPGTIGYCCGQEERPVQPTGIPPEIPPEFRLQSTHPPVYPVRPTLPPRPSYTQRPPVDPRPSYTQRPPIDPRYTQRPPIDPRPSYTQRPPIDPRYTQRPPIDPRPSYTQRPPIDPRYTQRPPIDPRYTQRPPIDPRPSYTQRPPIDPRPSYTQRPPIDPRPSYTQRPPYVNGPGYTNGQPFPIEGQTVTPWDRLLHSTAALPSCCSKKTPVRQCCSSTKSPSCCKSARFLPRCCLVIYFNPSCCQTQMQQQQQQPEQLQQLLQRPVENVTSPDVVPINDVQADSNGGPEDNQEESHQPVHNGRLRHTVPVQLRLRNEFPSDTGNGHRSRVGQPPLPQPQAIPRSNIRPSDPRSSDSGLQAERKPVVLSCCRLDTSAAIACCRNGYQENGRLPACCISSPVEHREPNDAGPTLLSEDASSSPQLWGDSQEIQMLRKLRRVGQRNNSRDGNVRLADSTKVAVRRVRINASSGRPCNETSFEEEEFICCNNVLRKRIGVSPACCNTVAYDMLLYKCCDGKVRTSCRHDYKPKKSLWGVSV